MLINHPALIDAILKLWNEAIEVERRPFQCMKFGVMLTEELLCAREELPVLQKLRIRPAFLIQFP